MVVVVVLAMAVVLAMVVLLVMVVVLAVSLAMSACNLNRGTQSEYTNSTEINFSAIHCPDNIGGSTDLLTLVFCRILADNAVNTSVVGVKVAILSSPLASALGLEGEGTGAAVAAA